VQGAGVGGGGTGVLQRAARLAATQPGLSFAEFKSAIGDFDSGIVDPEQVLQNSFAIYRQLLSPTGSRPGSGEEATSPEPEGPGRFQATRPGDVLGGGAASLRFGA